MRLRLLSTTIVTVALLGAMSLPSGASAPNPYAQMKQVIADADSYNTVHLVSRITFPGFVVSQVTDAGRTIGRQTNTLTNAGKTSSEVIELIDGTLYVKGGAMILEDYMGLSTKTSNQLANKWFVVPAKSAAYAPVVLGLTVSSAMSEVTMTKTVTTYPATAFAGANVQALKGVTVKTSLQPASNEVLYLTLVKAPLPIEAVQTYKTLKASLRFSNWNETITLARPNATLQLT